MKWLVFSLLLASCATTPPAQVSRVDSAEHRVSPNGMAEVAMLVRGQNAFLGILSMKPGAAVPLHRDATEEYIFILEGTGTMVIDGQSYVVGPNSVIYMPPNAEVSFQNGDEPMVGIQIFAGPEPADKYNAWTPR